MEVLNWISTNPWMTVIMCGELYGSPWPPGHAPELDIPIKVMCENAQ